MHNFKGFSFSVLLVSQEKKKTLKVHLATLIYMWLWFWFSFLNTLNSILEAKLLSWGHVLKPLSFTFQCLAQLLKSFFLFPPPPKPEGRHSLSLTALCVQVPDCVRTKRKEKKKLPSSLLLKSKKPSIHPYNQKKKIFHLTLFPGIDFGQRNYFKEFLYLSKLYFNLEKLICLSNSLIGHLPQIQNARTVSAHLWVWQNRIFLHKTFPSSQIEIYNCLMTSLT